MCVLHDIDLLPLADGILLTGGTDLPVSWDECLRALRGADPESAIGTGRLTAWLQARRFLADTAPASVASRIRPVGLPVGHVSHPGPEWAWHSVLGGAVELGVGLLGPDLARPEGIVVVDPAVWLLHDFDALSHWPAARSYLTAMALLAADRRRHTPDVPLRPMGDCDVVTLLCSAVFRTALAGASGDMVTAGVPMRDRGWTELRRIDPAFTVSAAAATDPVRRGFTRPLLITADEVVMVAVGGRPADSALRDGVPGQHTGDRLWDRPVRYR